MEHKLKGNQRVLIRSINTWKETPFHNVDHVNLKLVENFNSESLFKAALIFA